HFSPARTRRHELRPAPVKLAMVALAHLEVTGPSLEPVVEPPVPQSYLRVQDGPSRNHAATSARALLPIVHVVLLECAGRAEAPDAGQSDRFLDIWRRRFVGVNPRPDLCLFGPPWMPDAECARRDAQHREIREHRADN